MYQLFIRIYSQIPRNIEMVLRLTGMNEDWISSVIMYKGLFFHAHLALAGNYYIFCNILIGSHKKFKFRRSFHFITHISSFFSISELTCSVYRQFFWRKYPRQVIYTVEETFPMVVVSSVWRKSSKIGWQSWEFDKRGRLSPATGDRVTEMCCPCLS